MQRNINEILLEFLHIVKYPNNKEKFIKEFEDTNKLEALANIAEKLPLEIQEKIRGISKGDVSEIMHFIKEEDYQRELIHVSHEAFEKMIAIVSPIITLDQKKKIAGLVH